nr:hypothetical protein [Streptomyces violaceorubidus]
MARGSKPWGAKASVNERTVAQRTGSAPLAATRQHDRSPTSLAFPSAAARAHSS